jgi:hypothetical protein
LLGGGCRSLLIDFCNIKYSLLDMVGIKSFGHAIKLFGIRDETTSSIIYGGGSSNDYILVKESISRFWFEASIEGTEIYTKYIIYAMIATTQSEDKSSRIT